MRFRVYCWPTLIADTYNPDPAMHLIDPNLKLGDSVAGSFEFTLTSINSGYKLIKRITSLIVVKQDNKIIWTGRVRSESEDFWKRRKYTCEGALSFLNDTHTPMKTYKEQTVSSFILKLIRSHNSRVDDYRKFALHLNDISDLDGDPDYEYYTENETTWEALNTKVLERLGGHVVVSYKGNNPKPVLSFYDDFRKTAVQEIIFGSNLLDYTKNWDMSNLATVILPRGKEIEEKDTDTVDNAIEVLTGQDPDAIILDASNPGSSGDSWDSGGDASGSSEIQDAIRPVLNIDFSAIADAVSGGSGDSWDSGGDSSGMTASYSGDSYNLGGDSSGSGSSGGSGTGSSEISTSPIIKKYVTVKDINGGSLSDTSVKYPSPVGDEYVYSRKAVAEYGRIERVVDFNDIDKPKLLYKAAKKYLASQQFDDMSITISAIDLHAMDSKIDAFEILDKVRVLSPKHGLDKYFPVVEISIPLENPSNTTYSLGLSNSTSMSGKSASSISGMKTTLRANATNVLDIAKLQSSQILNAKTRGYVTLVNNEDSQGSYAESLVISDTRNWENANRLWTFGINGIGYSDSTYGEQSLGGIASGLKYSKNDRWYKIAITMDGTIVADFIKTGMLSDGVGKNYWNMATGDISISPNTKVTGTSSDINSIINMANTGANKKTGSDNLLTGTKTWKNWRRIVDGSNNASWSFSGENALVTNSSSKTKSEWLANPIRTLSYAKVRSRKCCLSFEGYSTSSWGTLNNSTNCLEVGFFIVGYAGKILGSYIKRISLNTSWSKHNISLTITDSSFSKTSNNVSFDNGYFDVRIRNVSTHKIYLRKMKLEEGTASSAWSESDLDRQIYTQDQLAAYDLWLGQQAVFDKLTNKGKNSGLYIQNGKLYLNADYIQSGYIKAGLIKAGVLTDKKEWNSWNLASGKLVTQNLTINGDATIRGAIYSRCYIRKIKAGNTSQIEIVDDSHASDNNVQPYVNTIKNGAVWFGPKLYNGKNASSMTMQIGPKCSITVKETLNFTFLDIKPRIRLDCREKLSGNKYKWYGYDGETRSISVGSYTLKFVAGLLVQVAKKDSSGVPIVLN